jgi:hypothetical protein
MHPDSDADPRHKSVDHAHPTDVGMMRNDAEHVPGTGVLGDEDAGAGGSRWTKAAAGASLIAPSCPAAYV